ncbi:tRNA methyltransferase 10, partial [Coelomomyces lativittatus]
MSDKEMKSLCKQIELCYASNRRSNKSLDVVCTSVSEKLEKFLTQQNSGYKGWKMKFKTDHYCLSSKDVENMVYLTADSENVLETLEQGTKYIVGGLVDHNHFKDECLNKAKREGLKHAKLPISEYISMQSRKVLTVNHCVEILLKYLDTSDWKEAFLACIPKRKVENNVS